MLTDERRSARHPGAASMQLHGTARHCRLLCQSLRRELSNLAPRLRPARRTVAGGAAAAHACAACQLLPHGTPCLRRLLHRAPGVSLKRRGGRLRGRERG
eukprot:scaffold58646_cov41-Phaeocystis_antarctica.AAC.1